MSRENLYPLAMDASTIREWSEGERVFNGLVVESARVVNKKFELSYKVARESLDDDMSGTVQRLVSRLRSGAGKFRRHEDKLVFSVIRTTAPRSTRWHCSRRRTGRHLRLLGGHVQQHRQRRADHRQPRGHPATLQEFKGADGDPINDDPASSSCRPPSRRRRARSSARSRSSTPARRPTTRDQRLARVLHGHRVPTSPPRRVGRTRTGTWSTRPTRGSRPDLSGARGGGDRDALQPQRPRRVRPRRTPGAPAPAAPPRLATRAASSAARAKESTHGAHHIGRVVPHPHSRAGRRPVRRRRQRDG